MYTARHVVSCFLSRGKYLLLLKRSAQVNTYQDAWSGVSGSVEDDPLVQALREIHEEVGLGPENVRLSRRGSPLEIVDDDRQIRWLVHPFLFVISEPFTIRLSWEHTEHRWVDPRTISELPCVPMLQESLRRVWDTSVLGPEPKAHDRSASPSGGVRSTGPQPTPLSTAPSAGPSTAQSTPLRSSHASSSYVNGEAALGPGGASMRGVRASGGYPSAAVSVNGSYGTVSRMHGASASPLLDEGPLEAPALPVDDAPEDEALLDPSVSFVRPPWEPRSSGQGQVAQLKVRLATVTGEFPNPRLSATPAGEEIRPPRRSGQALLEDSLLEPVLISLRDAPCLEPVQLLNRCLEALELAGDRSGAANATAWVSDIRLVAGQLLTLRPSLPFLAYACAQVLYELQMAASRGDELASLQRVLTISLQRFQKEESRALSDVVDEVSQLIPPGGVVATVGYSPILLEALRRNPHFGVRLVVPEGRPRFDGRRMARESLELGKSVTLITDAAFGLHLADADLVVVEGYGLLLDGSVVARVGSFPFALTARHYRVPLYVAATCQRLDLRLEAPSLLVLEERRQDEVWEHRGPGLDVRNVAFDRIPGELITGILTEEGMLEPRAVLGEVRSRAHLRDALL